MESRCQTRRDSQRIPFDVILLSHGIDETSRRVTEGGKAEKEGEDEEKEKRHSNKISRVLFR